MTWAGSNGVSPGTLKYLQLLLICWQRWESQTFHCLEKAYCRRREWTSTEPELRNEESKIWQCYQSLKPILVWFHYCIYSPFCPKLYWGESLLLVIERAWVVQHISLNWQPWIKYSRHCTTEKCMPKILGFLINPFVKAPAVSRLVCDGSRLLSIPPWPASFFLVTCGYSINFLVVLLCEAPCTAVPERIRLIDLTSPEQD